MNEKTRTIRNDKKFRTFNLGLSSTYLFLFIVCWLFLIVRCNRKFTILAIFKLANKSNEIIIDYNYNCMNKPVSTPLCTERCIITLSVVKDKTICDDRWQNLHFWYFYLFHRHHFAHNFQSVIVSVCSNVFSSKGKLKKVPLLNESVDNPLKFISIWAPI